MHSVLFFAFASAAVGFSVSLLVQRRPTYSAISLGGVMLSLAPLYLMSGAEFVAIVHVIVGLGIITGLVAFAMKSSGSDEAGSALPARILPRVGAPLIVILLGVLVSAIYRGIPPDAVVRLGDFPGQTADFGLRLLLNYLLPFEAVSVLILAAAVGTAALVRER
jgi:NADH-quinone oxidoreductase subunit J